MPGSGVFSMRPDAVIERAVVGAGQHGHLEMDLRDSEHRNRRGDGSPDTLRQASMRTEDQSDWSTVMPSSRELA
jgi:hypothetical protein